MLFPRSMLQEYKGADYRTTLSMVRSLPGSVLHKPRLPDRQARGKHIGSGDPMRAIGRGTEYQYTAIRPYQIARHGGNALELAVECELSRSTGCVLYAFCMHRCDRIPPGAGKHNGNLLTSVE
jgi:hypothetical protein